MLWQVNIAFFMNGSSINSLFVSEPLSLGLTLRLIKFLGYVTLHIMGSNFAYPPCKTALSGCMIKFLGYLTLHIMGSNFAYPPL